MKLTAAGLFIYRSDDVFLSKPQNILRSFAFCSLWRGVQPDFPKGVNSTRGCSHASI